MEIYFLIMFFLRRKKSSGLIDFYFSCNDFFIYDLCICINAWCFNEKNELKKDFFNNLIRGYQSVRKLEKEEIILIPFLCHASSLRFFLTRIDNWKIKMISILLTIKIQWNLLK